MEALATEIRPKLESIGDELAPSAAAAIDREVFPHVARHARRTVNPPDDTWVAIGCDKRGYKKDVHFKVAVSRNCVRLLFEVGPEYYDKAGVGVGVAARRRAGGRVHRRQARVVMVQKRA